MVEFVKYSAFKKDLATVFSCVPLLQSGNLILHKTDERQQS